MGRPPSNGAPSFRFHPAEVAQMDAILQKHEGHVPPRDLLVALAHRFSQSPERAGKIVVQMKQVWNWFQNRRFALRAKLVKSPGKPNTSPVTRDEVTPVRNGPPIPQQTVVSSGPHVIRNTSEPPLMEFEAKCARDGAWYDVQEFLSHRYLETGNPEVLVRFSGFGPNEDEWVNIRKHVRQRSLPCEASECIAVLPGDLILCFQEGKEQALYFDAHVLDAQRRRHDVRGCRCRFLVHYDHDQSEEIVSLRKMCRRPETDYRLQMLHAAHEAAASSSVSVGPPVGPPTPFPIGPPTPSPIGPLAPNSVSPAPLTVSAQISAPVPEQKTVENDNPAQIPVQVSKKVDSDNPAQFQNPVTESNKIETDDPALVSGSDKFETAPVPLLVPEPNNIQTDKPTFVPEPNNIETDSPVPVSVPGLIKVKSENPDPLPEPSNVERNNLRPSDGEAGALANFTGPIDVNKLRPSDGAAGARAIFTGPIDANKLRPSNGAAGAWAMFTGPIDANKLRPSNGAASARAMFTGPIDANKLRPSDGEAGARSKFMGPIDANKLLKANKAEVVVLTGRSVSRG